MSTITATDAPTTHESWCTDHVHGQHPGDLDFCRATSSAHGVEADLSQQEDGGPVFCDVYARGELRLSPEQLRQVAAMLSNMADRLDGGPKRADVAGLLSRSGIEGDRATAFMDKFGLTD